MVEQHDRRQVEAIGLAVDPTPGRDPVFDAAPRFLMPIATALQAHRRNGKSPRAMAPVDNPPNRISARRPCAVTRGGCRHVLAAGNRFHQPHLRRRFASRRCAHIEDAGLEPALNPVRRA
jgi:hypothetical protein